MANETRERTILPARDAPHQGTSDRCPNCGFEHTLHREQHDELLEIGSDVIIVPVWVDVCEHCGERIYDMRTVGELEAVEERVRHGDLAGLSPAGTVYRADEIA